MKISIAVPSYNYSRFLKACLNSIKEQTHQNYEVLIADGGSTDDSLKIIHEFCNEDSRFKLISTLDKGQADAIFKAFNHATGDIFCFLNADDCYLSDQVFSKVINDFKSNQDVSVLTYGGLYIDASGQTIKKINYRYHPLDGFHWMRYRTAIIQPATFWLDKVYDSRRWPSRYHFVFDVVFFYEAYLKFKWVVSDIPVAGYRLHGDNKSMSVKSKRIIELAAFEEIKFGKSCFRSRYLLSISRLVKWLEIKGKFGQKLLNVVYFLVNTLAYISFYRLPSI